MKGSLAKIRQELQELREHIATLKLEAEITSRRPPGPYSDFEEAVLALQARITTSANRRRLNYVTVVRYEA